MKAHQIIQAISAELRQQIVTFLQENERPAYRAVVTSLAGQRKLRPQFILDKSRPQQAEWLLSNLTAKSNDSVAEQLLQIWLLKAQPTMLTTFLDAVEIKHDGKGQVDDLPEEIPRDKAKAGIDALLAAFPAPHAALYLHMSQLQRKDGWEGLTQAIAENEAVKL